MNCRECNRELDSLEAQVDPTYCARCRTQEYWDKRVDKRKETGRDPKDYRFTRQGLSQAEYTRVKHQQGGGCALCERTDSKRLMTAVRVNGELRALLCNSCRILQKRLDKVGLEKATSLFRTLME